MNRVLAVVVLYQMSPQQSETVRGLTAAFASDPELKDRLDVLLWDNSKIALPSEKVPGGFSYHYSALNAGTAGAFTGAMDLPEAQDHRWMFLLDQDTHLTSEYIGRMLRHVSEQDGNTAVAAIAGTVRQNGFTVSPRQFLFNRHRAYPAGESGIAKGKAFAIHSGTMLRIAALRDIGGHSKAFWLDYADYYIFQQFYLRGWKVWRAADAHLEHEMTVMDYDNLMSTWRYALFLSAESAFNDIFNSRLENAALNVRILLRILKQRLLFKNPEFSRMTLRQFVRRMTTTRAQRLKEWERAAENRLIDVRQSD